MTRRERETEVEHAKTVRVDKWLFAARFFKSRALAVEAIAGGKVAVNDEAVKPARELRPGDRVWLRLGPYEHTVVVRVVSERRGPGSLAATYYEETAESRAAREKHAWMLKHAAPTVDAGAGRPTKRDRRDLDKLRDG